MKLVKVLASLFLLFLTANLLLISSCKEDETPEPFGYEPIRFVQPDSSWISAFPGETLPLEVVFTTDRPIDSIWARVHVDSTNMNMFSEALSDSLFVVKYSDKNNKRTYTGSFTLPVDTLIAPLDVIRIQFNMRAQSVVQSKQLRIDVK